jgi:hypothetical protein
MNYRGLNNELQIGEERPSASHVHDGALWCSAEAGLAQRLLGAGVIVAAAGLEAFDDIGRQCELDVDLGLCGLRRRQVHPPDCGR